MANLTVEQANKVYDAPQGDITLAGIVERRAADAKSKWEKKYDLSTIRTNNKDLYLTKYADKKNPEEAIFADNRIFVAIRTITPYLTARLTQPEITPADSTDLGLQFAKDFEKIVVQLADDEHAKYKLRAAASDLLEGQRVGWVKWGYKNGKLTLKHVNPSKIIVDADTDMFEEPHFLQEEISLSVAEILKRFPHNHDNIIQWFGIAAKQDSADWYQELEKEKDITESWTFIDDGTNESQLTTIWMYQKNVLGASVDGLFKPNGNNMIPEPMIPYIWFNFLNDGTGKIDETSFLEQAKYSQKNYEKLGQAITDNASYGTSGVPVFAKDALADDDVPKVKFAPDKRIVLDLKKTGVESITQAFTTWQAPALQGYVVEMSETHSANVDHTFGTPAIMKGEGPSANTLGQDQMLQDQSEGRLQEPVDCIDLAMLRFFRLEAQFIYRYFTEDDYYRFQGDDGDFEEVMLTHDKLDKNADMGIRVATGTNLPVNRNQKIAVIMKLLQLNKAPTLESYKILGVFDDADKAFKEFIMEQADPQGAVALADQETFSREAYEDLYAVAGGNVPDEREDINPEYIQYVTDFLNSDKLRLMQQADPKAAQAVAQWVQMVVAKAQLKMAKLASQQPVGQPGQPQPPGPGGQTPPGATGQPAVPQGPPQGAMGPGTPMTPPITVNLPQVPPGQQGQPQAPISQMLAQGALSSLAGGH